MMSIFRKLRQWLGEHTARVCTSVTGCFRTPFRRRYNFEIVEGKFPKKILPRTLYVLTEDGMPWQAALMCPCGCRATLDLNLLPDERPQWSYSVNQRGAPSLNPSVNRHVGCKSHFFLRGGHIIWV